MHYLMTVVLVAFAVGCGPNAIERMNASKVAMEEAKDLLDNAESAMSRAQERSEQPSATAADKTSFRGWLVTYETRKKGYEEARERYKRDRQRAGY